jgi:hypothetical protein
MGEGNEEHQAVASTGEARQEEGIAGMNFANTSSEVVLTEKPGSQDKPSRLLPSPPVKVKSPERKSHDRYMIIPSVKKSAQSQGGERFKSGGSA